MQKLAKMQLLFLTLLSFTAIIATGCNLSDWIFDTSDNLPDLTIVGVQITSEFTYCGWDGPLGTRLYISNQGNADAALFHLSLNGEVFAVEESISAKASITVWFEHMNGNADIILDVDNEIVELDESNNTHLGPVPVPTPLPPCTATP